MSIKCIFYSKFDPYEGPKVIHQVPEDSIISPQENAASTVLPTPNTSTTPLLSFPSISRFLIPRQSLCGNLISLRPPPPTPQTPPVLVLSYPICISAPHYPRNEFIFNFALVLSPPDSIDIPSYKSVVTKLAHLMRSLETQSRFLSEDTSPPGTTNKIYSLCEMLMEDLNNYCECMIPIDELNTLNIKLFPTYPNPPPVAAWHVPLITVKIEKVMDENWDLTMQRIIPFVNGVNSIKKIAMLADADLRLTRKCIKHLVYYGCALLLDIFSFNAIYAPTAGFGETIARDEEMQKECARYVNTAFAPGTRPMRGSEVAVQSIDANALMAMDVETDVWPLTAKGEAVDGVAIVQLFACLRQGLDVRGWYAQNSNMLANIDMRRFLTFGVIKGFLYRIHRYPFATGVRKDSEARRNGAMKNQRTINSGGVGRMTVTMPRSMSSEMQLREDERETARRFMGNNYNASDSSDDEQRISNEKLKRYLDGTHCLDEICTELEIGERELEERLKKGYPEEVVFVCR